VDAKGSFDRRQRELLNEAGHGGGLTALCPLRFSTGKKEVEKG